MRKKNPQLNIISSYFLVALSTVFIFLMVVSVSSAQTWNEPACGPTGCNTPTPINVSGTAQTKAGNFILGGRLEVKNGAPQLWLNENDQTSASLGLWRFLGWNGNLHLYRNLSTTKDFATQSRVISILGENNNIGLGVEPTTKLDINGQIKIRGGAPGVNKILASDVDGLASWKTPTEIGISGGGDSFWTGSGDHIYNNNIGNVGVGIVNNLSSRLNVGGSIKTSSANPQLYFDETDQSGINGLWRFWGTDGHLILQRNNSSNRDFATALNAMYINKDGNVGVGKPAPVVKLDVEGSGAFSAGLGVSGPALFRDQVNIERNTPQIRFNETDYIDDPQAGLWRLLGVGGNFHIQRDTGLAKDFSGQLNVISMLSDGNVGIGVSNPSSLLTVQGNTLKQALLKIVGPDNIANSAVGILVDSARSAYVILDRGEVAKSNYLYYRTNDAVDWLAGVSGNTSDYRVFKPSSSIPELLIKKLTGNVGINTQDPSAKLDVNGTVRIRGGAPGVNKILASDAIGLASWKDPAEVFTTTSDSKWTLSGTNISNNNTGNVGIGISNPITKLDVAGGLRVSGGASIGVGLTVVGGGNNDSGINVTRTTAGNTHVIIDRPNQGQTSYVKHATGGTTDWYAGINARQNNDYQISNTFNSEVGQLTIKKDSGNVGINTNAPTAKLDVNGTVRIRGGVPVAGKILASDDNTGLASWKTPAQLGISSGPWTVDGADIYNSNTGYVGIGGPNLNPNTKLHVNGNAFVTADLTVDNDINVTFGNVGIGTDDPSTKLDVNTGGVNGGLRIKTNSNSDSVTGNISFTNTTSEEVHSQITSARSGGTNGRLTFSTRQGGDLNPVLSLNELGNVIIPSGSLSVIGGNINLGKGNIGISLPIGENPTATIDTTGTIRIRGGAPGLNKILASDATGLSSWKTPTEIGIGGSNWTLTDNNLTNKNTGNVGIGLTNPTTKLDITGKFRNITNETGWAGWVQNQGTTGTNSGLIITAGSDASDSILLLRKQNLTNVFKVNGLGNVGIGVDSPTAKLDVNGDTKITGALAVSSFINANRVSANSVTIYGGDPAPGKVLTATDSEGNATWGTPASGAINSSQIYTKREEVNNDYAEAYCESGDIALSGGIYYTGNTNGSFTGAAVGTGGIQDGVVTGAGTLIGFTSVKPPISRPGSRSDISNSRAWYCSIDGRSGGDFVCYARCLNL